MQSLEIISVNIWQILISLCNLLLLFLILKKFLYKPVRKVLAERERSINEQYEAAGRAENDARLQKELWEDKMSSAEAEASDIIKKAADDAEREGREIIDDSRAEARRIRRRAEEDAESERRRAEAQMKKEIADVSASLTEKMLNRELSDKDHRELIDRFLSEIGEEDDGDK